MPSRTTPAPIESSPPAALPVTWLRIHHHSTYRYPAPVAGVWQTLRLKPRDEPGQTCREFTLAVRPEPREIAERRDGFGNATHHFSLSEPHLQLHLETTSIVERTEPELPGDDLCPDLADCRRALGHAIDTGEFELEQFRRVSPFVPALPDLAALAGDGTADGGTVLEWMRTLGDRFAREFRFLPGATEVSTPLQQVLHRRSGVCQDFTHLFIACARHQGLAAAYVSGYILTAPPPGRPRLRGADAMHAWVAILVPGFGWVEFDPTNNTFAGSDHIVVARGRDYGDVSPIRGIFHGGGSHPLLVGVTVEPAETRA